MNGLKLSDFNKFRKARNFLIRQPFNVWLKLSDVPYKFRYEFIFLCDAFLVDKIRRITFNDDMDKYIIEKPILKYTKPWLK